MVMLIKRIITKRIIINKFYKVFKTQAAQQVDNNDIIKIIQLVQLEQQPFAIRVYFSIIYTYIDNIQPSSIL